MKTIEPFRIRHTVPNTPTLEYIKPFIKEILQTGWVSNYKYVKLFEQNAAEYLGVDHAIAVSSCTSGMMLVLSALGLKGNIAIPSYTFSATAIAAIWNGLKPVFVDCYPATYNIRGPKIPTDVSAILAVHVFGNPCDVANLQNIADNLDVPLIYDSAHAFGAKYYDQRIGSFGTAEVFSLAPTKICFGAEGGLVTTNDARLAELVRAGRTYGYKAPNYDLLFVGLSARMQEFSAILALYTLENIDPNLLNRRYIANYYTRRLAHLEGLDFQEESNGESSYNYFGITINPNTAKCTATDIYNEFIKRGIEVKRYFNPPLHEMALFSAFNNKAKYPNTEFIAHNNLTLPIYERLTDSEIKEICRVLIKCLS